MNYAGTFDFGLFGSSPEPGTDGAAVTSTPVQASASSIIVDDAQLLFSGDYARRGVDLVLSKDGHDHVIQDYFKGSYRSALSSPDGATLSPDLVKALVGEVQVAQAAGGANAAAQVIGTVSKLTGSATAIRNGVSVMLNVGDQVQKGDVVQAGADSSLNLTFIDGTVFGLSANARMVLNEMVYDPNGSSNSSLMSLIQGTITFVAGETAKNGDMRVDTPVATMGIRGTAVLVEIGFEVPGQGSAPPVKFQVLVEPGGRVGSYVLYNKNTGAIIGTVNQAGQVTSVAGTGDTTIGTAEPLSPIAQAIIQQTLQQYFPNYVPGANPRSGGSGSGSTPGDPVPGSSNPDPIKFLPPVDFPIGVPTPVPINLPTTPGAPPVEVIVTRLNTAPTVTVAPVVVVLPVNDTSFKIGDQVTITDPDAGDVATPYVPGSARIISATGPNGTPASLDLKTLITVDPQTGQVSYDPAAFKFLAAGQKAVYVIEFDSSSGPDTTHQTLTFTVDGNNDGPVVASVLTGAVNQGETTESFDLLAGASDPDLGETATLTIGNVTYSLNGGTAQTAAPGGVTLQGTTLHVDPAAFAYLSDGETATLVVSYKIIDAHGASVTQTETITITGVNDQPTVVSTNFTVTPYDTVTLNGTSFTIADPDSSSDYTFTVSNVSGGYFVVDPPEDQNLRFASFRTASETTTFTMADLLAGRVHFVSDGSGPPSFDLQVDDGSGTSNSLSDVTPQTAGYDTTNRAPTVDGPLTASADEGDCAVTVDLLAGAADADHNKLSVSNVQYKVGGGSASSCVPDGVSLCGTQLTFDPKDPAFDHLAAGETLEIVVSYDISDGNGGTISQTETITITGTNDRPMIESVSFQLTEGCATVLRACDIGITDPDSQDFTFSVSKVSHGKFQIQTEGGNWCDTSSFTSDDLNSGRVRFVHDGSEHDASFSIKADDGSDENAVSNTYKAKIEIQHVNDAPIVLAAPLLIAEGGTVVLTVLNFLTYDPDDSKFTFNVSDVEHGTFKIKVGNHWEVTDHFTTADLKAGRVVFIHDGSEVPPSYTVTADDGHHSNHVSDPVDSSVIFIPVNDAPTIQNVAFHVAQGHSIILDSSNFVVSDPDSTSFKFEVSRVSGGHFETLNYNSRTHEWTWSTDTKFTTAELDAGHIRFVQDGSNTVPKFWVKADDGSWLNSDSATFKNADVTLTHAPEFNTRHLDASIDHNTDFIKVTGLSFSDQDHSQSCGTYELEATARKGTVELTETSGNKFDLSHSLSDGFIYRPLESGQPYVEKITVTVTDPDHVSDQVNFVFQVGATDQCQVSPLVGTSGKDIIVASSFDDTLTGKAGADQFVFAAHTGHDTITDFKAGTDKIDLHMDAPFCAGDTASFQQWLSTHAVNCGGDTLLRLDDCGHDTILLEDVKVSQLHIGDFIVHGTSQM